MGPSLSLKSTDPGRSDFERLKSAVERLARGEGADWSSGDPDLDGALERLAHSAGPHLGGLPATLRAASGIGSSGPSYLVLVRIDRFEALRSRVGERVAIGVLCAVREQITRQVKTARIGRLGRGVIEFAFEPEEGETVEASLAELHQFLERQVEVESQMFAPPIFIGATVLSEGLVLAEAVQQAERALSRAEVDGVKFALFCEKERAEAAERLALMRDLREGIAAGQLTLAYQPKLNVRTGQVDALEALARWRHPVRGAVPPDQFIALAEETGDIRFITETALTLAIRDQAALLAAGRTLSIYVNLSGCLVTDEGFCLWVQEMCAGAQGRIGLEITETAVIADPERALRNLCALAEAGIDISIDDYGSGLSSLAYLKALPAKELKIDKAFVHGLSSSHRDPLIVRSTIDLAHALQMQVTAEGVDDPAAFALLRVMGCDRVQGYLIAPPLELSALQTFLDEQDAPDAPLFTQSSPLLSLRR